ncbi:PaaI family thioesterase [Cereibacter sphaeroides]|uniref:PaaI family thioesterase n=1 Tax=Cereibacter sphaeroides TaxID=1063 RepID=UPI001F28E119|nr:PaaI family thioesterase [Cereibacter sphaeroides]MCE6967214.1 PaaI family thioesterase [Cereibacter sphaeroides]
MGRILDAAELEAFLAREFPQVAEDFVVVASGDELVMRLKVGPHHLRPGGTVSGPSMFALADVAMYLAILARIGPVALAVTTNISMDFMRKPESGRDLIGHARLLKLGRILAVGDVLIRSDGSDEVVARAGLTYSIPPSRSAGLP